MENTNLAHAIAEAYHACTTRGQAIAMVLKDSPQADEDTMAIMWDAIDAYQDMFRQ